MGTPCAFREAFRTGYCCSPDRCTCKGSGKEIRGGVFRKTFFKKVCCILWQSFGNEKTGHTPGCRYRSDFSIVYLSRGSPAAKIQNCCPGCRKNGVHWNAGNRRSPSGSSMGQAFPAGIPASLFLPGPDPESISERSSNSASLCDTYS